MQRYSILRGEYEKVPGFFCYLPWLAGKRQRSGKSPTINVKPNEVIPEEAMDSLPSESLYLLNSISRSNMPLRV
jgi:hypothetical protein